MQETQRHQQPRTVITALDGDFGQGRLAGLHAGLVLDVLVVGFVVNDGAHHGVAGLHAKGVAVVVVHGAPLEVLRVGDPLVARPRQHGLDQVQLVRRLDAEPNAAKNTVTSTSSSSKENMARNVAQTQR